MRIYLEMKHWTGPADLEWGRYANDEAPWFEVALSLRSPTGELITRATRSLAQYEIYPLPEMLMLHLNGANKGLADCLKAQGVIVAMGTPFPIGDEVFAPAALTVKALAELRFAVGAVPEGPKN